tara:strand:- start:36 stop:173 length:138 start_codon:yes stop_codon:yes gene_type:complete
MANIKVVLISLAALGAMVLTFTVDWIFIAVAALLSFWGWRELLKK